MEAQPARSTMKSHSTYTDPSSVASDESGTTSSLHTSNETNNTQHGDTPIGTSVNKRKEININLSKHFGGDKDDRTPRRGRRDNLPDHSALVHPAQGSASPFGQPPPHPPAPNPASMYRRGPNSELEQQMLMAAAVAGSSTAYETIESEENATAHALLGHGFYPAHRQQDNNEDDEDDYHHPLNALSSTNESGGSGGAGTDSMFLGSEVTAALMSPTGQAMSRGYHPLSSFAGPNPYHLTARHAGTARYLSRHSGTPSLGPSIGNSSTAAYQRCESSPPESSSAGTTATTATTDHYYYDPAYCQGAGSQRNRPSYHHGGYPRFHKEEDFDIFTAIFTLVSLTSYIVCQLSTLLLAYFWSRHEERNYRALGTVAILLGPTIIINLLSIRWTLADNRNEQHDPSYEARRPSIGPCGWTLRILLHFCLLGPVLRYIDLLRFGVKSWTDKRKVEERGPKDWQNLSTLASLSATPSSNAALSRTMGGLPPFEPATTTSTTCRRAHPHPSIDYYLLTVYCDRDSSLLALFGSLVQCSLQLVFQTVSLVDHYRAQLTTLSNPSLSWRHGYRPEHSLSPSSPSPASNSTYRHPFTEHILVFVLLSSLFELSWSISSYHRAVRRSTPDKRNLSPIGTMLQFAWHGCLLASRVLAIGLFLTRFTFWLCPIAIGHWGIMSIWVMHQGTHFFPPDQLVREYLSNMAIGAIYLFTFINVKDEPTRFKYLWYYAIIGLENITFAFLWWLGIAHPFGQSPQSQQYYDADDELVDVPTSLLLNASLSSPMALGSMAIPHSPPPPAGEYSLASVALFMSIIPVTALFVLGLLFMQIYYWFAHPNGRPLWINKAARCC